MIRLTTTRRLASLIGRRERAEARIPAVQRRLAWLKAERDQLAADLAWARAELAGSRQVEDWLKEAIDHLSELAEAPVEVIVHDGVVYGVQRSRENAKQLVQRVAPEVTAWATPTPETDLRSRWVLSTHRPPQLTFEDCPPNWGKVLAHYALHALREQHSKEAASAALAKTAVLADGKNRNAHALPGGEVVES